MTPGEAILRSLQKSGLAVTRIQDGKRMGDGEIADVIQKALDKEIVPRVAESRGLIMRSWSPVTVTTGVARTDDDEVAGIIEQESGVVVLAKIIRDIISDNATHVSHEKVNEIIKEMGL